MSTYITLTGRRSGEPLHIKKSAIEIVKPAAASKAGTVAKWLGGKDCPEGALIWFVQDAVSVSETYTEVVKMLR